MDGAGDAGVQYKEFSVEITEKNPALPMQCPRARERVGWG
jgi:hypothetical protein